VAAIEKHAFQRDKEKPTLRPYKKRGRLDLPAARAPRVQRTRFLKDQRRQKRQAPVSTVARSGHGASYRPEKCGPPRKLCTDVGERIRRVPFRLNVKGGKRWDYPLDGTGHTQPPHLTTDRPVCLKGFLIHWKHHRSQNRGKPSVWPKGRAGPVIGHRTSPGFPRRRGPLFWGGGDPPRAAAPKIRCFFFAPWLGQRTIADCC